MYRRIRTLVQREDNNLLEHDLKLAPAKIHDYLLSIIKEQNHEPRTSEFFASKTTNSTTSI